MSSSDKDGETERRRLMAEGIGFVLNTYLNSRNLLNPTSLAVSALNQYDEQTNRKEAESLTKQEAEMRAMVSQIRDLAATFEGGALTVHMNRSAVLGLLERKLRRSLAVREAAMTATFRLRVDLGRDADHEGELGLADRSIFLKFVPEGESVAQMAILYLDKAKSVNPSEYWLLVPSGGEIEIPLEPVFKENKISRGKLKTLQLSGLISELVGSDYDVQGTYDSGDAFKFVITRKKVVAGPAK